MKNQHMVVLIYHWKPHSVQNSFDVARKPNKPKPQLCCCCKGLVHFRLKFKNSLFICALDQACSGSFLGHLP